MWIELLTNLSIGSLVVSIGGGVLACVFYRSELKRVCRIARAEIDSRLPKKRPSIEIAMHADLEVDMKWWDEEFAKLDRSTVGDWARMVNSRANVKVFPGQARKDHFALGGITSITDGDMKYGFNAEQRDAIEDYCRVLASAGTTTDGAILALQNTSMSMSHGFRVDARKKIAGEILEYAKKLEKSGHDSPPEDECDFCEYVDSYVYCEPTGKRYKTAQCWECEEVDRTYRIANGYVWKQA